MEEEKNLNQNNEQKKEKGKGLLYSLLAILLIFIAVVGATYAYFNANVQTNEGDVSVESDVMPLMLTKELDTYNPKKIIPARDAIAQYSFEHQLNVSYTCDKINPDDGSKTKVNVTSDEYENAINPNAETLDTDIDYESCERIEKNRCTDDYGKSVCGYYHFTISSSDDNAQEIESIKLNTVTNTFENLVFALYTVDNNGNLIRITDVTNVPTDPNETMSTSAGATETQINIVSGYETYVRPSISNINSAEYYLVTWLHETCDDFDSDSCVPQNESDGNKTFNGTITIGTAGGGKVTGTIAGVGE